MDKLETLKSLLKLAEKASAEAEALMVKAHPEMANGWWSKVPDENITPALSHFLTCETILNIVSTFINTKTLKPY